MSIFKDLFGKNEKTEDTSTFNWNLLTDESTLAQIDELSEGHPVLIFKHSTSCFISKTVLQQFEKGFSSDVLPCYFLDLKQYRAVSNAVATRYEVTHESPQVLVIKNKKCIYHASHNAIKADALQHVIATN